MTLRCRKGDMAIVLRGSQIGKIVTVLRYLGTVNRLHWNGNITEDDDCWQTTDPDPMQHKDKSYINGRAYRDSELLPIRPGDLDESEETEKTLEFSE